MSVTLHNVDSYPGILATEQEKLSSHKMILKRKADIAAASIYID